MNILSGLPETPLTLKQESAAVKTAAGRTKLVLANMREAFSYSKNTSHGQLPDGDLFSLCYTALTNAAKNYKPNLNRRFAESRFFGYAKPYIRGEIRRTWSRLKIVANGECVEYIDEIQTDEDSEDKKCSYIKLLNPPNLVEPEFDKIHIKERWARVAPILAWELNDQERMIVDLHYRGGFNFKEIGRMLEITRSAVQGTHSHALRKVRNRLWDIKEFYTN